MRAKPADLEETDEEDSLDALLTDLLSWLHKTMFLFFSNGKW